MEVRPRLVPDAPPARRPTAAPDAPAPRATTDELRLSAGAVGAKPQPVAEPGDPAIDAAFAAARDLPAMAALARRAEAEGHHDQAMRLAERTADAASRRLAGMLGPMLPGLAAAAQGDGAGLAEALAAARARVLAGMPEDVRREFQDALAVGMAIGAGTTTPPHLEAGRARVQAILDRLAPGQFAAVVKDRIGGGAMVGGGREVYVGANMLQATPDDDRLAAVIAHEITHTQVRDRLDGAIVRAATDALRAAAPAADERRMGTVTSRAETALSRMDESGADAGGVRLLARAGYDPRAMVRKLEEGVARDRTGAGADHPEFADRVAAIEAIIQAERLVPAAQ